MKNPNYFFNYIFLLYKLMGAKGKLIIFLRKMEYFGDSRKYSDLKII